MFNPKRTTEPKKVEPVPLPDKPKTVPVTDSSLQLGSTQSKQEIGSKARSKRSKQQGAKKPESVTSPDKPQTIPGPVVPLETKPGAIEIPIVPVKLNLSKQDVRSRSNSKGSKRPQGTKKVDPDKTKTVPVSVPGTDPGAGPGLEPSQSKQDVRSKTRSKTSKRKQKKNAAKPNTDPDPGSGSGPGLEQSPSKQDVRSKSRSKSSKRKKGKTIPVKSKTGSVSAGPGGTGPGSGLGPKRSQSIVTFEPSVASVETIKTHPSKAPSKYKNVSCFKKFGLLIWKNFQILKHHKVQTLFEVLLPIIFVATVVIVRVIIGTPDVIQGKQKWPPFDPTDTSDTIFRNVLPPFIYFSPNTSSSHAPDIMKIVRDHYLMFPPPQTTIEPKGFETEAELLNAFANSKGDVLCGVVFLENANTDVIEYKLRMSSVQKFVDPLTLLIFEVPQWHTGSVFPDPQLRGARQPYWHHGGTPGYYQQGFTYLQFAIDASIIKHLMNPTNPSYVLERSKVGSNYVTLGRFTYSAFSDDRYLELFIHIFQIVIILSFIYPVNNIVKYVVVEKEKRLMESMKRMGIGPALHWTAWFVNHIFFLLITDGLMVVALIIELKKDTGVIVNSEASVIFVFLLSYTCSVVTFGFLLSTLFSTAETAVMASWIIFILTYLPYVLLSKQYRNMVLGEKTFVLLFLNTALAYGFRIILILDGFGPYGEGQHWSNIHDTAGIKDDLAVYRIIIMLFVDSVVYMVLAIYIEAVWPGQYGIPQKWYFPFQKSYWARPNPTPQFTKVSPAFNQEDTKTVPDIKYEDHPNLEKPQGNLKAGIRIRGLTKVFGTHTAVNDLNIDMFENQITALLGHNGAGKTTTMSMLTGLFPPTSGTAIVNEFDITTHMSSIQGNIGLCPQHDVLFDELTCEQHLKFYCWAKGCPDVHQEVDAMLIALNLLPKKTTASQSLSGGMKRKLSVGMALIGGSQVVIFDEPTAGMDPAARRRVWDILAAEKMKRTIILSTHFMDEADLLGDRIAVMADGQLQTVGSSLFLKQLYGDGYQLVIVKQQGCDVTKITELLQQHLGEDVKVASNIGAELSYSLAQEKSRLFPDLFDALEKRQKELGINSYGASITTMEEVFMRVGIEAEQKKVESKKSLTGSTSNKKLRPSAVSLAKGTPTSSKLHLEGPGPVSDSHVSVDVIPAKPTESNMFKVHYETKTGFPLYCQQFRALLVKKWLFIIRNWGIVVIQIIVPVLLILVVYVGVGSSGKKDKDIKLNLELFTKLKKTVTITPVQCHDINKLLPGTICTAYKNYALNPDQQPFTTIRDITVTDPTKTLVDLMLEEYAKSLTVTNAKYIIGLETDGDDVYGAYFNNQPYHAQPVALNFLMNAFLRSETGDEKKEIIIHNHPLPVSEYEKAFFKDNTQFIIFVLGMMIMFGYSFLTSSFAIFLIRERTGKAKHLQRVSGLNIGMFWIATFTFDFFTYLLTTGFVMIVIVSFDLEPYTQKDTVWGIFLLLLAFGWATIPLVYISSFYFHLPATGFTKLAIVNIFLGTGLYLIMAIIHIPFFEAQKTADALESVFLFLPIFAMGYGIYELGFQENLHTECPELFKNVIRKDYCEINGYKAKFPEPCCILYVDFFAWAPYGIKRNLIYLLGIGFIAFLVLAIIQGKLIQKLIYTVTGGGAPPADTGEFKEDTDVEEETHRIQTTDKAELLKSENLVLKNLTKHFGTFTAVHNLNLGVKKGECFGLLGVNGAGKTTTFGMLTGDLSPSSGDAFVVGHSIRKDMKAIQKMVGFCPQFDALIRELTGRETIRLFARLRGLHEKEINGLADKLGEILKFKQFLDKPCGPYSGGNKRKLSTAIALVGNPPLVFLDEPSSGMDPMARRHLWNCITQVRDSGASIVLTSHSMEECEALCTRLVIMVNGRFRCLGSIQHLKSKFSEGFTVTAQIRTQTSFNKSSFGEMENRRSFSHKKLFEWEIEIQPLQRYIEAAFPDSVLKDVHPGYVHYHVTNPSLTWGYLFRKMEEAKLLFSLEAYSVGQTSMDQIFLIFGKGQVVDV